MNRFCNALGVILFCFNLCIDSSYAQTEDHQTVKKTQVVIIGTIHSAHYENPNYSPEKLKEIILSLKPDAILNELPLSLVDPNGRPIKRLRQKGRPSGPESWASYTAAMELGGIPQIPFDRPDRQENFQRTKYFEKEKRARELEKICGQCLLENEPNSLNVKIAQLQGYAGRAEGTLFRNASPEIINSDAHDCVIRIKKSLWYEIVPELFEKYPECKEAFEFAHFFEDQWNIRNRIMADNIVKAVKEYPGRRLVVITGATHRYILRDLLENDPHIELKEYWEVTDINPKNKQKLDELNQSAIQGQSLKDPVEYILAKFDKHDLVMLGEYHWTREQPTFVQNLIKRCYDTNAIDVLFLEFGEFEDQEKIDVFLKSPEYNPEPVLEVLRNSYEFGWGYQEYFDIFKLIYTENHKRPQSDRIKIVLVDGPPSGIHLDKELYGCFKNLSIPEKEKWAAINWLREGIVDRDSFMAHIIEVSLFKPGYKGIYYAGRSHVRKDLQAKNYGRRYFSAGGRISRKSPEKVYCIALHNKDMWKNRSDFEYLEKTFGSYGKPLAIDGDDPKIHSLKLTSDIDGEEITFSKAFDGYILLNFDKDYHPCSFIPGFYDDEFAKAVWDRLRKDEERFEKLPPELEKFKTQAWSGKELRDLMRQGLH